MFTKSRKNAEKFSRIINGLLHKSFADEGDGNGGQEPPAPQTPQTPAPNPSPTPQPTEPSQINYEELIARARKEEKDKLYIQIKTLKDDLKEMTKQNNKNLLEAGTLKAEIDNLKNGGDSEEVTTLKNKIKELEGTIETLKQQSTDEETIRQQVEQEYEVKLYRTEQLVKDEVKDAILPMFMETVTGATKEEIDASIEKAKELTQKAKEQMGVTSTPAPKKNPSGNTKPSVPSVNPQNPMNTFGDTSLEDVRNLDPASPEYAEWRKKMGLR